MRRRSDVSSIGSQKHGHGFPCRLHVLLALESPHALIIRRGPTKQHCTIGWDRIRDGFTTGQWLKGRIYERRCDLSPDGQHFIYFAMNGRWESETKGSWTAISRAPYLKAIGLWAKGDCWHGGGLFLNSTTYWIFGEAYHTPLRLPKHLAAAASLEHRGEFGAECRGVYYPRMMRDGWRLREHRRVGQGQVDIFDKRLPGGWILRKVAHATIHHPPGKGCYYDEHQLGWPDCSTPIEHREWEWADADDRRLYWCAAGKLFAAPLFNSGPKLEDARELRDFNDMKFEPLAAPY